MRTFLEIVVKYFLPISGGLLGYISFFASRRQAKHRGQEEKKDWDLYADIVAESKKGLVFKAEPESEEFKRADRLRERGLLEQLPGQVFGVPGQKLTVVGGLAMGSAKRREF